MSDDYTVPPGWTPYIPILTGVIRALLAFVGGLGFAWANAVSGSQIEMIASSIMLLAAIAWTAIQKVQTIRKLQKAAVSKPSTVTPTVPL